jgi:murein L,D-transpeptidase YcbB/YkuD
LLRAGIAVGLALACFAGQATAQTASYDIVEALSSARGDRDVRAFYKARGHRPLWIRGSVLGPEAYRFLDLVRTADLDGLDPGDYRPRALADAIEDARSGSPKALAKAEMLLSAQFIDYVQDMRRPRDIGMHYVDRELMPAKPSPRSVLEDAAAAPSLLTYLNNIGWMHPIYGGLRQGLAGSLAAAAGVRGGVHDQREQILRLNLERARHLPAGSAQRYILVDAASARLWAYEGDRVRDTMKVVVGKSAEQTPMMAGLMRYTLLNPYWNIPPDLARVRAQTVLAKGTGYLKTARYEVLSDWSPNARVVDPSRVDWKGVAEGRHQLPLRQLPGKDNAMGRMKFMFPNELGIYLHDTPERELLRKADRRFSSGCVRLEDAPRLAKWLYGRPLAPRGTAGDQRVDLPQPVPVYITYLTAMPEGRTVAFRSDVYNRDRLHLAGVGGRSGRAR